MMAELGEEVSCVGVARRLQGVCDIMVIDEVDQADASAIEALGMRAAVARTVMESEDDKAALAEEVLALAAGAARGDPRVPS